MKKINIKKPTFFLAILAVIAFLSWLSVNVITFADEDKEEEEKIEKTIVEEEPPVIESDYVIKNAYIVDGTGKERYKGDVAIKGDEIAAVGEFEIDPEAEVIDATGMIVAPGFIDIHAHTEDFLKQEKEAPMILLQGVTTHIAGNCGTSVEDLEGFFSTIDRPSVNLGMYAGYKTLRMSVMGDQQTPPTGEQLKILKDKLARQMENGAFGLSTGLQYWPQSYATTEELIELCKVVKDYSGIYSTHVRSEEDRVLSAAEEAITIGKEADVPVEHSHIKTALKRNWGEMPELLQLIEEAREEGLDINADVYGYTFSSLDISRGGNSISEDDLIEALEHPLVMVGSDSGLNENGEAVHPRAYGNHPRIIRKYVREADILTLEEIIHKMTEMPADKLGLNERGVLKEGNKADIIVFDFEEMSDRADRRNPNALSTGVKNVFVNGVPAVSNGEVTGEMGGKVLKSN